MSVYEEHGLTADQLVAVGRELAKTCAFRNEPYLHQVFVVGDEREFAAITHYADAYLGDNNTKSAYERYKCTAGITINWKHYGTTYSIIGLHCAAIKYYNVYTLLEFLKTTAHEQQHMLSRIERDTGADHRFEDEPRTYATASTLDKILAILRRNYGLNIIAVPNGMAPLVRTLGDIHHFMNGGVSSSTVFSGVLRQQMEKTSGQVFSNDETWRATTYLSGGEHV